MSGSEPLLDRLSRIAEAARGDDERAATFARGLMLGAVVGAAIAGSTIWQRRQARLARWPASEPAVEAPSDADRGTASALRV